MYRFGEITRRPVGPARKGRGGTNPKYLLANEIAAATLTNPMRWLRLISVDEPAARRALVAIGEIGGIRNKAAYFTFMFKLYSGKPPLQ